VRTTVQGQPFSNFPTKNPEGRATAELTALVGARVVGEHFHPALVERFTVLEGELTLKREGQTSVLREGESAVIDAGVWHDWWNASDRDARARVEITPGERFAHMVETFYGLARLGHVNSKGMPSPLQLALVGQEFSDVIVFRKPPGGTSARDLRRPWADRALAWLSGHVPPALAHGASAEDVDRVRSPDRRISSLVALSRKVH
jgi:quercetin dioxygenase-like cupin family protein